MPEHPIIQDVIIIMIIIIICNTLKSVSKNESQVREGSNWSMQFINGCSHVDGFKKTPMKSFFILIIYEEHSWMVYYAASQGILADTSDASLSCV